MMLWIRAHQRAWRFTVLALLLTALIGPWSYDLINVPAQYPCSGAVRLEGDFCGIMLSGFRILALGIGAIVGSVWRFIIGETGIQLEFRNFYPGIILLLLFMPLLSLLFVSIRGDGRRLRVSHILILGVAIAVCTFIASAGFLRNYWALWGIWFYLGLLLSVLILELLNHRQAIKLNSAG